MDTGLHPTTASQKANPLGAHLLNHYYSNNNIKGLEQKKINYPVFALNSAKEIPLIMLCAQKEGLQTYGLIVVSGGRHRTPIMINDNKAFVIESLGTSKSKVGINSVAQVALGIQHSQVTLDGIYTFKDNRQVDSQSCGSDSFIALKQIFRIKDKLNHFVEKEEIAILSLGNASIIDKEEKNDDFFKGNVNVIQLKNLPPDIAKYTQTQTGVENYDYRNAILTNPNYNKENQDPENVSQYAKKHLKISSVPLPNKKTYVQLKDEAIELNARKMLFSNAALEKRRIKHNDLLTIMASTISENEIKEIIKESSGINLINHHLNDIPDSLFKNYHSSTGRQAPGTEDNFQLKVENTSLTTKDQLIDQYITEEMYKRRDEKTGVAPKGSLSLTELVEKIQKGPILKEENIKPFR